MRRAIAIGAILSVLLSLFPAAVGAHASAAERCFAETGFCVQGRFLDYWNAHGGLAINGYPLTAEIEEMLPIDPQGTLAPFRVQYFERVRMEHHTHPATGQPIVLLGQFGRTIRPADPPAGRQPGMQYFDETGHNVPGDFIGYWNANGGLPQFGFPISGVIQEQLPINPQGDLATFEVQYFERARFERHPGNLILLGQFGRRILGDRQQPPAPPKERMIAPLASSYYMYSDPQGRFTARVPQDWTQREDGPANNVYFRQPGPLWGAEIALNDGRVFTNIDQVDPIIEQQLQEWLTNYQPISKEKVYIGPHPAYRRLFQHTNVEGQSEIIVRIYFLSGGYLYQVNGFMLPDQRSRVESLVDGLAGSIVTNP